jgi:RimK family alpha-L-glutamate ligase
VLVDEQRAHPGIRHDDGPDAQATVSLRVAVLGSTGGWHAERLERALTARGHTCVFVPVTRMVGRIDGAVAVTSGEVGLEACDVVVVRGIPRGSLEQVVFRVDALHVLTAAGVRAVNPAPAIERTVDKFLASALLVGAGVPTPRTIACERADDALVAFADLGADVIVKPLFGSMGFGMARVDDPDVAQRVFRALEIERAVYYLQETIPHDGVDVRAFVVGDRVIGAIERVGEGWRANLARGARARAITLSDEQAELCVRAARVVGADYAGVDLLRAADGREFVLEVNGIPGWRGVEDATGVDVAGTLVGLLEG